MLLRELVKHTPGDFGYQRSRWSTELMAIKIRKITGCCLHASTVRRWLPAAGLMWRRAAPTRHIRDLQKDEKMALTHKALDECSVEHPESSVPVNGAAVEKGTPLYENRQPIPGWQTRAGKSVAILGSLI